MARSLTQDIFARLGTRPIINASGIYTDLGGSRLSPTVWAAMAESNQRYVRMVDLLESSGRILAAHLGAEAGRVTTGAAASIVLMVSAAITGGDGAASERLPDTTGLRNEVVLQRNHRYKYDRQITMTGATLVLAGTEAGTSEAELEAAIGPKTAALFVPAHRDGAGDTVPLARVVAIARRHGLKVLVDAAYMCWPLEAMPGYVAAGADLVCFSAKYFGGPNAGGFMVGTRAMIDAVTANNFTRYESGPHLTIGRVFKLDRQTVVGVVAAFEEWRAADHQARWARYARLVEGLRARLAGLPGVKTEARYFTMDERLVPDPVNSLVLELAAGHRLTHAELGRFLAEGNPSIAADVQADRLIFCFDAISDDEVDAVGARLIHLLGS
ncbi:MAG: aminotransferase class V-fold PLP-dependent enzyme [Gemmatimonadales bacterium]